MPPQNKIFFDIETGGFKGANNPVLSISWAHNQEQVQSRYADPTIGSRISRWSENKIWEPIKRAGKARTSEKDVLLQFLKVLEGAPAETQLIGWNIGYQPYAQGVTKSSGFDVPFLLSRARKFGMEERYQKTLRRMAIRDEGSIWAYRIAKSVTKGTRGIHMVQQGRLHKDVYMEAVGYMKQASKLAAEQGLRSEAEIAEALSREGIQFAGWKQESTYKLLFGETLKGAHQSAEDVAAVRRIMSEGSRELDEAFIKRWGEETLENKLVSSLKTVEPGAGPERYLLAMKEAEEWGVRSGVEKKLAQLARESGVPISQLRAGRGIPTVERIVRGGVVSEMVEKAGAGRLAGVLEAGTAVARAHWGKIAIGASALALMALKPGTWFSGKDDEYNVIEGLQHGGEAERMRRLLTDFGSGLMSTVFGGVSGLLATPTKEVMPAIVKHLRKSGIKKVSSYLPGIEDAPPVGTVAATQGGRPIFSIQVNRRGVTKVAQQISPEANIGKLSPVLLAHEASEVHYTQRLSKMAEQQMRKAEVPKGRLARIKHDLKTAFQEGLYSGRGGIPFTPQQEDKFIEILTKIQDKRMVASHMSMGVVADELLLGAKLGPEHYKAIKAFRMGEMEILAKDALLSEQIGRGIEAGKGAEFRRATKELAEQLPLVEGQSPRTRATKILQDLRGQHEQFYKKAAETREYRRKTFKLVSTFERKMLHRFPGFDDAYNTIEGLRHEGAAGATRSIKTDFGSGLRNTDNSQRITEEIFENLKQSLHKYGDPVGTGHKRIIFPTELISPRQLEEQLGFTLVNIGIPEAGQTRFQTWRHVENLFHIHQHGKNLVMHEDVHPASTMKVLKEERKAAAVGKTLTTQKKATLLAGGTPHVMLEGVPGLYYYLRGQFSGAQGMAERVAAEMPEEYISLLEELREKRMPLKTDKPTGLLNRIKTFFAKRRGDKPYWLEKGKYFAPPTPRVSRLGMGILAGAGLLMTAGAVYAYNRISGSDDDYNTIEGLRHGGEAEKMRKAMTAFGSGFTGLLTIPKFLAGAFAKVRGSGVAGIELGITKTAQAMTAQEVIAGMRKAIGTNASKAQRLGLAKLERETAIAVKEGFESVVLINPDVTRRLAEQHGVKSYVTKQATIAHERLHQTVTHLGLREGLRSSPINAGMDAFMKGRGQAYVKTGADIKDMPEEFFAAAMEAKAYAGQPVSHSLHRFLEQTVEGQEIVKRFPVVRPRHLRQGAAQMRKEMLREDVIKALTMTEPVKKIATQARQKVSRQQFVHKPLGEALKDVPPPLPIRPPPLPKLPRKKIETPPPLPTVNTIPSPAGPFAKEMKKSTDFTSPVNLDSATSRARDMYDNTQVAPKLKSVILEPRNAKARRRRVMQTKHREAQVRHSKNSLRPGRRHRQQAGRLVI